MLIFLPKETHAGETRVSMIPDIVAKLAKKGVELTIESGLGTPCGFTDDGLPVGLQIVGRRRQERSVLELAYAFQQATETWRRRPAIAVRSP